MKRLILFMLIIVAGDVCSQQWQTIPNPVSSTLRVIRYAGNGTFIAAGNSGKIIRITDAGNTVAEITSPITGDIRKLQFDGEGTGYALGGLTADNQGLIKTTDYGNTWTQVALPAGFAVTFSAFPYSTDNQAMLKLLVLSDNGTLYYSGDGGNSYSVRSTELAGNFINNIDAVNDTLIFAAGSNSKLAVSNNQGTNWTVTTTTDGDYTFLDITDLYLGYTGTSSGTLNKLHESGTGNFYSQLVKQNSVVRDAAMVNELTLWIIAGNSIFRSNRYMSYMTEVLTTSLDMYSVAFRDEKLGFAVGDGGKLFRYIGSQPLRSFFEWYPEVNQGADIPKIINLSYKNPNSGLGIGSDGKLYQTENSGKTWTLRSDVTHPSNGKFTSVDFAANLYSEFSGVLAGENGYLAVTEDGGRTWRQIETGFSSNLNFVRAKGNVFVAAGDGGIILTTQDRGKTWVRYNNQFSSDLISVDFQVSFLILPGTDGVSRMVASGSDGTLYCKPDLTNSLKPVNIRNGGLRLNTVLKLADRPGIFGSNKYWLAAGDGGTVFYSMDNGVSFHRSDIPDVASVSFKMFISGFLGAQQDSVQKTILIGSAGAIYESQDMGHTWYKITPVVPFDNNSITFTDFMKAQIHSSAGYTLRNIADYPTVFIASQPRNDLIKGDTILIPVSVNLPQRQGPKPLSALQLKIVSPNPSMLRLQGTDTAGTLSGRHKWFMASLGDSAFIRIAAAGSSDINESGVIFNIRTWAASSGSGTLNPDSLIVNTTRTGIQKFNGYFDIWDITPGDVDLNGYIEAFDASQILKFLSSTLELNRRQLKNANVTTDTSVSAFDASVILRYLVGQIGSLPYGGTDNSGGNFTMPALNASVGSLFHVPLAVSSGSNIYSFEQSFSYDPSVISFEGVDWGTNFGGFAQEYAVSGSSIKIFGAGTQPVNIQSGNFIRLKFRMLNGGQTGQTIVKLTGLRLNEMPVRNNVAQSVINIVTSADEGSELPKEYSLAQNYPNPFNPSTRLSYAVPNESSVRIILYNSLGEEVKVLVDQTLNAGYYNYELDGLSLSSGVYYYRIEASTLSSGERFNKTMKMILMK